MASDSLKAPPGAQGQPRVRSAEEVRAEIARAREELATAAADLKQQVAEKTDWRTWVRDYPVPFMAGAFMLGFLLGYTPKES